MEQLTAAQQAAELNKKNLFATYNQDVYKRQVSLRGKGGKVVHKVFVLLKVQQVACLDLMERGDFSGGIHPHKIICLLYTSRCV